MTALEGLTGSGNELVAMVGYAVIILSLIWFGGSVLTALIAKRKEG